METAAKSVWLGGERFDVAYLVTPGGGGVKRFVTKNVAVGPTGGVGRYVGRYGRRRFVGVFVHPASEEFILRVGREEVPLDGSVTVRHETRLGGLTSRLSVRATGRPELTASTVTLERAVLQKLDSGYDAHDESVDDFLADVADIATSAERRRLIASTNDPSSGPWHLLGP